MISENISDWRRGVSSVPQDLNETLTYMRRELERNRQNHYDRNSSPPPLLGFLSDIVTCLEQIHDRVEQLEEIQSENK